MALIDEMMKNPLSPVKNTRQNYYRHLERTVMEVEVQFKDEPPAWIPFETLIAMQGIEDV